MSKRAPYLPHVVADARENGAGALSPVELKVYRRHLETLEPRDRVREAAPTPERVLFDLSEEVEGALGRRFDAAEMRELAALLSDAAADMLRRAEHAERRETQAKIAVVAERIRGAGWGRPCDVLKNDDQHKAAMKAKEEARERADDRRPLPFDART